MNSVADRISYCCERLHCDNRVKMGALKLLNYISVRAPDLIIRKNPNVVAAQLICLVARAQNNKNITHTDLGLIMNTSAPSVGKYRHYLEPWVRQHRLIRGLK